MTKMEELLRERSDGKQVQALAVFDRSGEKGYYITRDYGETWTRVRRLSYRIVRFVAGLQ